MSASSAIGKKKGGNPNPRLENLTGRGRPKGVPNKTTTALKEAILQAAERSGDEDGQGGIVGYLVWLSKKNEAAFSGLVGKVLPHTIAGDPTAPLKVEQVQNDADAVTSAIFGLAARAREAGVAGETQH